MLALPVAKADHHNASLLTGLGTQHADKESEKSILLMCSFLVSSLLS